MMSRFRNQTSIDSGFPPTEPLDNLPLSHHINRSPAAPKIYTPNRIRPGSRIIIAALSASIFGWAAIGITSGHANIILGRRVGILHISGIPATIFSIAILLLAIAFVSHIIDHYDTRDNEHSYTQMRNRLGILAAVLVIVSLVVGALERKGHLPYTDEKIGIMSTEALQNSLTSNHLAHILTPKKSTLEKWASLLSAPAFLVAALWYLYSKITRTPEPPESLVRLIATLCIPPACTGILYILAELSSIATVQITPASDIHIRQSIALNIFLLIMGTTALIIILAVIMLRKDKN